MKASLSFLLFICLSVFSLQEVKAQNWSWAFSSEYTEFIGQGVSYTNASGMTAFGGSYTDSIKIGSVRLVNNGSNRLFMAVADANGNILHAFSDGDIDLGSDEYIYDIALDHEGNIIIIGVYYTNPISLGGVSHPCAGGEEAFVAKYTSNGDFLWARTLGSATTGDDFLNQLVVDENNNIYITGFFGASDLDLGTVTLANSGVENTLLMKYDKDGNLAWAKTATMQTNGPYAYARGTAMALKSDGLFWLGFFKGQFTLDGHTIGTLDPMKDDIYIVSLTRDGVFNWLKQDGGADSEDDAREAVVLGDTTLLVTGYYEIGNSNIAGIALYNSSNPSSNLCAYLAAYDTDGTGKWAVTVLKPGTDQTVYPYGNVMGILLNSEGNAWIPGEYQGEVTVGETLQHSVNNSLDIFMLQYNTQTGAQMEVINNGDKKTDYLFSLGIDACDQLYCYGFYRDSIYFGDYLLNNPHVNSAFLAKYETNTRCTVTGVEEVKEEAVLLLIPNPAHDYLQLNLPDKVSQDFSITINNAMGQQERFYNFNSASQQLTLPLTLKPGMYVVQLIAARKRYTSKLIVE